MPVILAVAACCGIPILLGAVMALKGRMRGKAPELKEPGTIQVERD